MASASPIAALNHRFAIPGIVNLVEGHAGLPVVRVETPDVSGEIYLHGAHVTSWKPAGADEVIFVSSKARYQSGVAIRGGVPVCFPWFSERTEDPKSPPHGLVRTKAWQLEAITHADSNVTVALSTTSDEETRKQWFGDFHLLFVASFGDQLRMELIATNHGSTTFKFEEALHSYFRVGNVESAHVRGLSGVAYIDKTDARKEKHQHKDVAFTGETDRVYKNTSSAVEIEDPALRRRLLISKEQSRDTVIWNPWAAKAKGMADLGAEEWRNFVCVETCNVGEHGINLAPTQSHTMSTLVSVNEI